jgi:RNA polymerase-binding protein DksA
MTRTELRRVREKLETLRRRLRTTMSRMADEALKSGGEAGGHSHVANHAADWGADPSEREVSLLLLESEEQVLSQIREAIGRIDAGRFGQCDDCGRAISAARLRAIPYTTVCIDCANRRDNA